jgi:hypothetical protein
MEGNYKMGNKKNHQAEHGLTHNPGYDFLRLVYWMKEIKADDPNLPFAPYLITTISVISACCGIEGFINMVGQKIDKAWDIFEDEERPTIKERLSRIYTMIGKSINFGQGNWQKVIELFKTRNMLVHPQYVNKVEFRCDEIPDIFEQVNNSCSTTKVKTITEEAIDTLLSDAGLPNLRHVYHMRSYYGPVRDD